MLAAEMEQNTTPYNSLMSCSMERQWESRHAKAP